MNNFRVNTMYILKIIDFRNGIKIISNLYKIKSSIYYLLYFNNLNK